MRKVVLLLLLCILPPVHAIDCGEALRCHESERELVSVELSEYSKAFRNPFKGFRGELNDAHIGKYGTLTRTYIQWNDIENSEHDGIEKIIAYCNTHWSGVEHTNTKVIPRVYLHWPNRGTYWPDDMITGDYDSDKFRYRVVSLIQKLGEVWDNDPRVAFIEMGIWGLWGEHHHEAFGGYGRLPRMPPDMQKLLGDAFQNAFRNKLVMVRYPDDFRDYHFGFHWDSFAHPEQEDHIVEFLSPRLKNRWKSAIMGGEMAFDWGNGLGTDPTDAVVNFHEAIVDAVRLLHWNHLGWVSDYDQNNPVARENAEIIQKSLGYRFVIDSVRYTKRIEADREFYFSFDVRNTGSSPVHYNLPVEVSLLEEKGRTPVWRESIQNIDIRTWLPGDDWNSVERIYEIRPEKYTIEYVFTLPTGIPFGEYIVALSILDPAGNVPALRFANTNYFAGGLHPIGRIGLMSEVRTVLLNPYQFDDLAGDRSLYYGQ